MKREREKLAIAHACMCTYCIIIIMMMMMVRTRCQIFRTKFRSSKLLFSFLFFFVGFNSILVHVCIVCVVIKICAILIVFVFFVGSYGARRRHMFFFPFLCFSTKQSMLFFEYHRDMDHHCLSYSFAWRRNDSFV